MFKDTQKITEVYDQKILQTFKETKLNLFSTTTILQNYYLNYEISIPCILIP